MPLDTTAWANRQTVGLPKCLNCGDPVSVMRWRGQGIKHGQMSVRLRH